MEDITPEEFIRRRDAGEKLNVLDVREEWEHEERNLNGLLIPLGTLPNSLEKIENWKDEEIIVHCRSGARSANAKNFLTTNGFNKVRNLIGGITAV
jgi:rhodanese-related sulfurtransferase